MLVSFCATRCCPLAVCWLSSRVRQYCRGDKDRSRCDSGCRAFGRSTHRHSDGNAAGRHIICSFVTRWACARLCVCVCVYVWMVEGGKEGAGTGWTPLTHQCTDRHSHTNTMRTHGDPTCPRGTASAQPVTTQDGGVYVCRCVWVSLTRQQKVLSNTQDVYFSSLSLLLCSSFLGVFSSILVSLSGKLETNGCFGAKCLNLSKETQIDTLKENWVPGIAEREGERGKREITDGGITQDICNMYTPPKKTNIRTGRRT